MLASAPTPAGVARRHGLAAWLAIGSVPAAESAEPPPNIVVIFCDDPGETLNVADERPEVVKRLETLGARCREDLGDSAGKVAGDNVRPAGRVEEPRLLNDPR